MFEHEQYYNQERWFCGYENVWLEFIHKINYYGIYIAIYLVYSHAYMMVFVCLPFEKIMKHIFILLQYVLPLSLLDNFDNNVKKVIYDLGKYMM